MRFAVGRLRLGVGAPTIIEAVARRQADGKEARELIERAYNLRSDLGLVSDPSVEPLGAKTDAP